jgi:transglutaminase-like putative cysteine protease
MGVAYLSHRESHPRARGTRRLAGPEMIVRVGRRIFSADAIGAVLVVIALQTLTYGIASSLRNTDTRSLFWVCLVAALISFGLSKRKLSGIQASAGMVALGLLGIWILGASLTSPLLDLGNAILPTIPRIIRSIYSYTPIGVDTTEIAEAWRVITEASSALMVRVQVWLIGYRNNVIVDDGLVRTMIWTLIMWLFSAWIGWFTGRRNAIASLLPSILLLALITSYSEHRIETLWLMVFILLLLMGVWNYKNHIRQWERRQVDYSESIQYDSSGAVLFITMAICMIAFITPSVSWREIRDFFRERNKVTQNETADILGIQEKQIKPQSTFFQKPSMPREHLLTGGYAQSQKIVMTINTGESPPISNAALTFHAPRYYWRSVSYDTYVSAGWVTSSAPPQTFEANTPLIPGLLEGYKLLHLDVQMVQPEGRLFWSGILFSADIPFTVDWRVRPQSSLFADQSALLEADMFAAASNADSYRAESYVPQATAKELRAASTDYPEEISERYLSLPTTLPERVRELARKITDGMTNPYDKAKAIETYLRNYPYDLEISAPPEGQDVTDYFLFDLKKGYCDYYATAMVVLARSSGIPARFVSGYSPGEYNAPNARYVVRELHAHSWAEVYFPEIGWVEFEPTAAQPAIDRSGLEATLPVAQDSDKTASQLLNRFRLETAMYWLSPIVLILVLFLLYFILIEQWLYMRLAPALAIERVYRRLYRLGRPLAGERALAETAYEFMRKLLSEIDRMRQDSRFTKLFSSVQKDIELLTDLYQDTLFSHKELQKNDARIALKIWKHLRLRLMVARINVIARRLRAERRVETQVSKPVVEA